MYYENDERISELRNKGLSYGEIAKELNLSRNTVASVCKRFKRGNNRKNKFDSIKTMRESGKTYQEIADILGARKDGIADYCQKHGLAYSNEELYASRSFNKGLLLTDWNGKVQTKFNGLFELVKIGESEHDGERKIIVRCKQCKTEKQLSSQSFKGESGKHGFCEVCKIKARKVQRQLEKQAEQLKKEKEQTKKKLKSKQIGLKLCECGKVIPTHKHFCPECAEKRKHEQLKAQWALSEVKRRSRLQKVKHDNDLTLEKLYERDNGVCHLCGGLCDWNDYHITNGQKQADNLYPSIDHLIVVSKGGAHTWDNVKLAHRICNTKRGTKTYSPPVE